MQTARTQNLIAAALAIPVSATFASMQETVQTRVGRKSNHEIGATRRHLVVLRRNRKLKMARGSGVLVSGYATIQPITQLAYRMGWTASPHTSVALRQLHALDQLQTGERG